MAKRAYVNPKPDNEIHSAAPKDAVKAEFAKRLQAHMVAKGWNQSELARRATEHTPKGEKTVGRDTISTYIRGKCLPGPVNLKALADTFGIEPTDLVPTQGMPAAGDAAPPLDVRGLDDDTAWLRVNQAVPWPVALKILELLKGTDEGE